MYHTYNTHAAHMVLYIKGGRKNSGIPCGDRLKVENEGCSIRSILKSTSNVWYGLLRQDIHFWSKLGEKWHNIKPILVKLSLQ